MARPALKKTKSILKKAPANKKAAPIQVKPEKPSGLERDGDQYFSRAVAKAFVMLDLLNRAPAPLTLNEMGAGVQLTKSSTFRLLQTLKTLKYVSQDADGRYVIAAEKWVTSSTQVASALLCVADEPMRMLNSKFKETISLAVLFTNHIEVIQVFESPHLIRMANTVGRIIPPHASSLGKAITAFQTAETCKNLLQSYGLSRFTPSTITDEIELMAVFAGIRDRGVAREIEESTQDGCCLGCPIFLEPQSAIAAISISMPKSRLPQEADCGHLTDTLRETARLISKNLKSTMQIGS